MSRINFYITLKSHIWVISLKDFLMNDKERLYCRLVGEAIRKLRVEKANKSTVLFCSTLIRAALCVIMLAKRCCPMRKTEQAVERCKTMSTLQKILGGKWKLEILYYISFCGIRRFGALRRQLGENDM